MWSLLQYIYGSLKRILVWWFVLEGVLLEDLGYRFSFGGDLVRLSWFGGLFWKVSCKRI